MKWLWITALSMFFATAFLACSDSPIEAKIDSDNIALASIVPLEGDSSDMEFLNRLKNQAMDSCMADPSCAAALSKLDGADIPVPEEGVSSASEGANDNGGASNGDASSSGSKGPVIASSANVQPTSSPVASSGSADQSSAGGTSSAVVASSSSKGSSVLNGACRPSTNTIERGESVTWSYVIINGTPAQTYDWTFDEGSSIATSKDATPSVSYAAKGTYGASLVVDKGLATEKTIGCQTKLAVTGKKVSGCVCSASSSAVVVSSSKPKDVTWTVSGCTGADPFTYAWGGGVSGTGTSATKTLSSVGTYTPTLTVTNSDGETMSPTCATVTATEMPGATCQISSDQWNGYSSSLSLMPGKSFYFKPTSVTGVSGTMSMTLTGGGSTKTVSVANGSNNAATSLTAPSSVGTYTYTLSVDGENICSATLTTAWPKITTTCSINGNGGFSLGSFSGWEANTVGPDIYVTMYRNNDVVAENLSINAYYNASPWKTVSLPTEAGEYTYKLDYKGNTVCTATYTRALQKPTCNIATTSSVGSSSSAMAIPGQTFYFKPGNSNYPGGAAMNMTLTFNGSTQSITVQPSNNSTTQLEAPGSLNAYPGTYPVTLSYNGETICSATLTVDYPRPSCNIGKTSSPSGTSVTAIPGKTVYFKPGNTSFTGQIDMTYTFNGSTEDITIKPTNSAISLTVPSEVGTYPITLSYGNNEVCSATLTAEYPAITASGCAIGKNVWSSGKDYFTPNSSFSNWSSDVGSSTTMTLYMDETLIGSASVNNGYNTPQWMQVTLPTDGEEHVFTLKYGNRTVCTVEYTE